jgi:hypothetical protein
LEAAGVTPGGDSQYAKVAVLCVNMLRYIRRRWSLYGKLDDAAFRKVVLVLLLVSGLAIVATGR